MSTFSLKRAAVVGAALLVTAVAAQAETVSSLRVMLHPYAAGWGELPAAQQARLEALTGTKLALTGSTRTGAIELSLAKPVDEAEAKAMIRKLRVDRSVLWAESIVPAMAKRRAKLADAEVQGQRLMVRLKADAPPVNADFLDRLGNRLGMPVSFERQIAQVAVLSLPVAQSAERLAEIARTIEGEAEVQYADPVRKARAFAAPNDPYYSAQWSLIGSVAGINAETAWTLQPNAAGVTVAVVDTGILPHPDLAGRVLPGFDFISDAGRARDGTERDLESARRRRLEQRRVRSAGVELLPRAVRRRHHRGQHEQRHRHRRHRRERRRSFRCACSARAAARSRTFSPACCGRPAPTSKACPRTSIRPRSST